MQKIKEGFKGKLIYFTVINYFYKKYVTKNVHNQIKIIIKLFDWREGLYYEVVF